MSEGATLSCSRMPKGLPGCMVTDLGFRVWGVEC